MHHVCHYAAGVPIKAMVAGISCGLVTGDTDDDYIVLTDIQGLEDFFGDMDFKVAGTHDGITAIQMDIKIHGLTRPIVEEAIRRTKEAREYILTEVMEKCIAAPRTSVGEYAPKIIQIQIDPQKIGDVVGQRGKTINTIIERTGVKIDITDEGAVSICGVDQKSMDEAANMVKIIATDFEAGQIFTGKVVSIKELVHSLNLHRVKREWYTFPRSPNRGSTVLKMFSHLATKLRLSAWQGQDGKNQLQHEGCTGRSINDEIPQYYQGRYVKRRRTSCSALGSRLFTRLPGVSESHYLGSEWRSALYGQRAS